jgi:hypothetical protein
VNHSIYSADRGTHLKIVMIALVAGVAWPALDCRHATKAATVMPMKHVS